MGSVCALLYISVSNIFTILVLAQHFPSVNLNIHYKGGHSIYPKPLCKALYSMLNIFGTGTSVVIIQGAL